MENDIMEPGYMRRAQAPLRESYVRDPEAARVVDWAETSDHDAPASNPLASVVRVDRGHRREIPIGVHRAVGGRSDAPTPGDLLCGALAACLDSTIRIIANGFGVTLTALAVRVEGEVDVRGTLRIRSDVPVAFQRFEVGVHVETKEKLPREQLEKLLAGAEASCIIMQTLAPGAEIRVRLSDTRPNVAA